MRLFPFTTGADDWKQFLAEPEKQWRTGFSARTLAYCWEAACCGLPKEVADALSSSGEPLLAGLTPLLAIPEFKVDLPGGGRASQNDIFVLARSSAGPVSIMVEGKVDETFGEVLDAWLAGASAGKIERLAYLQRMLGLEQAVPGDVRYQLLHRTVSAIIEAGRFRAVAAVLLVHSFSALRSGWEDYVRFMEVLGVEAREGTVQRAMTATAVPLFCAWVAGDPRFLES